MLPLRSRLVTRGTVTFAGWNPSGEGLAWADYARLHLSTGRSIPFDSYGGQWVGWSPDGRYIAAGPSDGFRVVDLKTGRQQTLMPTGRAENATVRWWR